MRRFRGDARTEQQRGEEEERGQAGIGRCRTRPGPSEADDGRAESIGGAGRGGQERDTTEDEVERENARFEAGGGGVLEGADRGGEEGDDEEGGKSGGRVEAGDGAEDQSENRQERRGPEHDGAAVMAVGDVAAEKDEGDAGDGFGQAEEANIEDLAGDLEDLEAEQDRHGCGSKALGNVGGDEEAELADRQEFSERASGGDRQCSLLPGVVPFWTAGASPAMTASYGRESRRSRKSSRSWPQKISPSTT